MLKISMNSFLIRWFWGRWVLKAKTDHIKCMKYICRVISSNQLQFHSILNYLFSFYTIMLCFNLFAQPIQCCVLLPSYKLQLLYHFFHNNMIYSPLLNLFYNHFVLSEPDLFRLGFLPGGSVCSFQSLNVQAWAKTHSSFSPEVVDRADCTIHHVWRWGGSGIKLRGTGWCRNKKIRGSII